MHCGRCKKYGLDPKKMEYFERRGLFSGTEESGDEELRRAAAIAYLEEAGLSREEIVRYFSPKTDKEERVRILSGLRRKLLDSLHETQRRIDRTDCLLYTLSRE